MSQRSETVYISQPGKEILIYSTVDTFLVFQYQTQELFQYVIIYSGFILYVINIMK